MNPRIPQTHLTTHNPQPLPGVGDYFSLYCQIILALGLQATSHVCLYALTKWKKPPTQTEWFPSSFLAGLRQEGEQVLQLGQIDY